ncbi:MAG: protoporphyrinogen oxidase HemJ [Gammaproteobacteria bacterium]|nr:protoporphyrinogen oxidase HemJ [Gammaproteobacteria bacterium]
MLWIKAFHVIAMVAWMSGLFYLPRLFVYHADTQDKIGQERFKIMEHRLYFWITTPALLLTFIFGVWLLWSYAWQLGSGNFWLHGKLLLVVGLLIYHILCGQFLKKFAGNQNTLSSKFYRWFNEVPTVLLIGIVILTVVKPF